MNTITLAQLVSTLEEEHLLVKAPANEMLATTIAGAACDSRVVRPGNLFICKGVAFRSSFLVAAQKAGAVAYLCDEAHAQELHDILPDMPALVVNDVRRAMALVSADAWGHPDLHLDVLGVTGTKGKSTVAYMVRSILEGNDPYSRAAIMGSIETYDGIEREESHNTTPEAPDLWRHLANAVKSGHNPVVMEVSSHGLKYDRVLGLHLAIGGWLNIGRDHISPTEHPNFEDYLESKLKIFSLSRIAVINLGTDYLGRVLSAARQCEKVVTVSAHGPISAGVAADYWAFDITPSFGSISFIAHTPRWTERITLGMAGLFNVENALIAIAFADLIGESLDAICDGLALARVPGRMEISPASTRHVIGLVDYAHNKLSYQRFFESVTKEFPNRKISVVLGAPGGKAQERRRELPEEAAKWADLLVYTEEDPGRERVEDICAEMAANTPKGQDYRVICDRTEAIRYVTQLAQESQDDWLVCLLAKGDETDQHVGEEFVPMVPDGDVFARAMREFAQETEETA